MFTRYTERLADTPRAGAKETHIVKTAPRPHGLQSCERFDCANQDTCAMPFRTANEIEAPVDSVGPIDIGSTGRAEHYTVTLGGPAKTVRRRIFVIICFHLYNASPDPIEK